MLQSSTAQRGVHAPESALQKIDPGTIHCPRQCYLSLSILAYTDFALICGSRNGIAGNREGKGSGGGSPLEQCRHSVATIRNLLRDKSLGYGECRPRATFDYPEHISTWLQTTRQGFIRVYEGSIALSVSKERLKNEKFSPASRRISRTPSGVEVPHPRRPGSRSPGRQPGAGFALLVHWPGDSRPPAGRGLGREDHRPFGARLAKRISRRWGAR